MPLNIAIIGGGIGGPATAIGLARQGHTVTLYERSENILEGVGFAFRITPNSDRCLKWLGIDSVAGGAVTANTGRMMNVDGKVLAEFKENVDAEKAKKASSVFAYRPSLQQQLLDEVVRSEVRIRKGMKVVDVDVENTTLRFEDGTKVAADLIVAADGVHVSDSSSYIVGLHRSDTHIVLHPPTHHRQHQTPPQSLHRPRLSALHNPHLDYCRRPHSSTNDK